MIFPPGRDFGMNLLQRVGIAGSGVLLAAGAAVGFAGTAGAATCTSSNPAGHYPPGQCQKELGLPAKQFAPGQQFTFHGSGFAPNSDGTMTLHTQTYVLGTYTADSSGVINGTARIPSGVAPGTHTLALTGATSSGQTLVDSATITITGKGAAATGSSSGSALPFTGANAVWPLTGAGGGMVLAGGLTLLALRRRRPSGTRA